MGLDPVDVLILPRVAALVIALPILTFIGSIAALYGGGLVAQFYGDMGPAIYIARLHEAISVTHFEVGILKAPFMASFRTSSPGAGNGFVPASFCFVTALGTKQSGYRRHGRRGIAGNGRGTGPLAGPGRAR